MAESMGPMRRRYWSEMDDKERIVKLQEELIRTQRHLSELSKWVQKLKEHKHLDGLIVTCLANSNDEVADYGVRFRVEEFKDK
jgi:hypothetical protein